MLPTFLAGYGLALSLIVVIGAQNAFVLRQGLRNENVLAVSLTCAASDAILIWAGIYGFDQLTERIPAVVPYATLGGALFLTAYGLNRLWVAWRKAEALIPSQDSKESLRNSMLKCLALTWLNPHVYLDTVVLIGSVSTSYGEQRGIFGIGAMLASLSFFLALAYFSRFLGPILATPKAWKILEAVIGLIMLGLAAGFFRSVKF